VKLFRGSQSGERTLWRVFGDATLRDTVAPLRALLRPRHGRALRDLARRRRRERRLRLPPSRRLHRHLHRGRRREVHGRPHGHRRDIRGSGGLGQSSRVSHHARAPQQAGLSPGHRRRGPPRPLHRLRRLRHRLRRGENADADTVAVAEDVCEESLQAILSHGTSLESLKLKNITGVDKICLKSKSLTRLYGDFGNLKELIVEDDPNLEELVGIGLPSGKAKVKIAYVNCLTITRKMLESEAITVEGIQHTI
jgi:hypothetical protein